MTECVRDTRLRVSISDGKDTHELFASSIHHSRSLVQIKSHAQKVLKRLEAGENVFRRLDENYGVVPSLIVQAAKQRESIVLTPPPPKSSMAKSKRKKSVTNSPKMQADSTITQVYDPIYPAMTEDLPAKPALESDVAALAASALCQLSALSS